MLLSPSRSNTSVEKTFDVDTIFEQPISSASSEDPPCEKWSSLLLKVSDSDSPKMALYKKGLYDPGSGEICANYMPMSHSSLLLHAYYAYPCIKDPGIMEALEKPEPRKIYEYDGQELYLALCKQMNVIPVRSFHRGLLGEVIDLRYYGINPVGVRAMCIALSNNKFVRRLDLTSNYLNHDACYHLGQLLGESFALQQLILTGCKIKEEGVQRLVAFLRSSSIELLDLSKNDINDLGLKHLALQISNGAVIKRLNLSHNDLTSDSALALAEAIEFNNTITHLDLSWNKLSGPKGINDLLRHLGDSKVLVELNISWNGLTIGLVLRKVLTVPTLRVLDLSNNRLSKPAARAIHFQLKNAHSLETLNLSHNPFTEAEALMILSSMRKTSIIVKELLMDGIVVNKEFVKELKEVLSLSCRGNLKVTYGHVTKNYTLQMPDLRYIVMRRLNYIVSKPRKCRLDIGVYFLSKRKEKEVLIPRELMKDLEKAGAPVDEDLINELVILFPGIKDDKGGKTLNLSGVVEFVHRLWPEKKVPLTPPPNPEPMAELKKKNDIRKR